MERWRNRVALVTGASSGIGAGICKMLSEHGLKVVGCARRVEKIQELAVKYQNIRPYKCDISKEDEVKEMFAWIESDPDLGQINLCVPNAGYSTNSSLLHGSMAEWKNMLDVNVLGVCLCTQMAIKSMIAHKVDEGQIVIMSSLGAHRVNPNLQFYCATKYAVKALLEGFRQELHGLKDAHIRISSISPGVVETDFGLVMNPDNPEMALKCLKSMKCLQPEDIAQSVKYILEMPKHAQVHNIMVRPTQQML